LSAVDCRNKDFLASWHYGLVLIDEDHGEVVRISADPLPTHKVGPHCRPSTGVAGSENLVGASGGDQGKDGEERTHGEKVSRRGGKKGR